MGKTLIRRLPRSVFFRLLAAIVLAGILMTLTVISGFFALQQSMFDTFQRSLAQYVRYLVRDIGDPPDLDRARAIADQTGVIIHFESPQRRWTVPRGAAIPDGGEKTRFFREGEKVSVGGGRQGHFISVAHGNGRLTFWRLKSDAFEQRHAWLFWGVCLILLSILACAYLYIRRVMQPVRWLTAAMDQYADGRLDYRMPLKRSDEFQDLAESVNHMAERIQALLEAKEKLLLDVSHELRSPIARLKVGLELLGDGEARDSLREDLTEMEVLVTEILETARLRQSTAALNLQKVDSVEFIGAVVAEFNNPFIELGAVDACRLLIDPPKIRTVLKNIIDNAVKYSGGSRRPVTVTATRDADGFRITVQDFGIGIPADDLPRVFEPFFRVDLSRSRETGGYGLGLSLCKAIMAAHGGDIHIESELGRGTRVVIRFPQL